MTDSRRVPANRLLYRCVPRSKLLILGSPLMGNPDHWHIKPYYKWGWYGCFQNRGYPQIIHFSRVFHYKPSILGYPYFLETPIFGSKHIGKPPAGSFHRPDHTFVSHEREKAHFSLNKILVVQWRDPFNMIHFTSPYNWAVSSLIYPKTTRFRFGAIGIPIWNFGAILPLQGSRLPG